MELLAVPQREGVPPAWDLGLSTSNIKSGFRKAGIFPINLEAIRVELDAAPSRAEVVARAAARRQQQPPVDGEWHEGPNHGTGNHDALLALAAVAEQELAEATRPAFTLPKSYITRMDSQILARQHLPTGSVLYTSQQARDSLRAAAQEETAKKTAAERKREERTKAKEIAKARKAKDAAWVFDPAWLQVVSVPLTAAQQQHRAQCAAARAERKRKLQEERAAEASKRARQ